MNGWYCFNQQITSAELQKLMVIVEQPEPVALENPSMDDLRAIMENPDAEVKQPEQAAEPEAKEEPKAEEVEKPEEEPEWLKKRVAKETEREAAAQRKIDEAVSRRKAKEAEAAALETDTGTAPVKTGKSDPDARPQKPNFATFEGTGEEFAAALEEYDSKLEQWLEGRTKQTVERQFQEREAQKAAQARWDGAVKEHGDKWESAVKTVTEVAPDAMQNAISALDNWSKVAVHLAANPAELTALADQFKAHPPGSPGFFKAVAQLGRLEEKITAAPMEKPLTKPKSERLPPPLSAVEAPAAEGTGEFDYASASPAQRRAYLLKGGLLD